MFSTEIRRILQLLPFAAGQSPRGCRKIPGLGDRHATPFVEPSVLCCTRCPGSRRFPHPRCDSRYSQKEKNASVPPLLLLGLRPGPLGPRILPSKLLHWPCRVARLPSKSPLSR